MDADAKMETECLPACGSFFYLHAVADAAETASPETDAAMTAVCGSSFCSAAAEASETVFPETDADADLKRMNLY